MRRRVQAKMHHQGENAGRQDYKEMGRVNTTMLEEGRI